MTPSPQRTTLAFVAVLGLACAGICWVVKGPSFAMAALSGSVVMMLNVALSIRLWGGIIGRAQESALAQSGAALATPDANAPKLLPKSTLAALMMFKFLGIGALLFVALRVRGLDPIGFAIGLSVLLPAVLAASFATAKMSPSAARGAA